MDYTSFPSIYDYTDPATNLAGVLPDALENVRLLGGAELVPVLVAAAHGYRRSGGGILSMLLWGFAGYMAPLPTTGFAIYEQTTGERI